MLPTPSVLMKTLSTKLDTSSFFFMRHEVDERYNPAERFENDRGKLQGELAEIYDLLGTRFQRETLHQRWLQRQVSFVYIPRRYNSYESCC
jgi:hypothetical protein